MKQIFINEDNFFKLVTTEIGILFKAPALNVAVPPTVIDVPFSIVNPV